MNNSKESTPDRAAMAKAVLEDIGILMRDYARALEDGKMEAVASKILQFAGNITPEFTPEAGRQADDLLELASYILWREELIRNEAQMIDDICIELNKVVGDIFSITKNRPGFHPSEPVDPGHRTAGYGNDLRVRDGESKPCKKIGFNAS